MNRAKGKKRKLYLREPAIGIPQRTRSKYPRQSTPVTSETSEDEISCDLSAIQEQNSYRESDISGCSSNGTAENSFTCDSDVESESCSSMPDPHTCASISQASLSGNVLHTSSLLHV